MNRRLKYSIISLLPRLFVAYLLFGTSKQSSLFLLVFLFSEMRMEIPITQASVDFRAKAEYLYITMVLYEVTPIN